MNDRHSNAAGDLPRPVEILPPEPDAPAASEFRVRGSDGAIYYAYRFPHPAVAAAVVLWDRSRQAFLLIKREHDPFKDHYTFPGGFMDVGKERIEETAARELFEEAGVEVSPGDLQLIDIRSDPERDPRDHVLDISFYAEVDAAEATALDEATEARWFRPDEIDGLRLAFDHAELWRRVRDWLACTVDHSQAASCQRCRQRTPPRGCRP